MKTIIFIGLFVALTNGASVRVIRDPDFGTLELGIFDHLRDSIKGVGDKINHGIEDINGKIKHDAEQAGNGIKHEADEAGNEIKHGVEDLEEEYKKILEDAKHFIEDVKKAFECSCPGLSCYCSATIDNHTVSVGMKIDDVEYTATVEIRLDGKLMFSKKWDAKNPPPVCVPVPQMPSIQACFQPYDLFWSQEEDHGCMKVELDLMVTNLKYDLGCVMYDGTFHYYRNVVEYKSHNPLD